MVPPFPPKTPHEEPYYPCSTPPPGVRRNAGDHHYSTIYEHAFVAPWEPQPSSSSSSSSSQADQAKNLFLVYPFSYNLHDVPFDPMDGSWRESRQDQMVQRSLRFYERLFPSPSPATDHPRLIAFRGAAPDDFGYLLLHPSPGPPLHQVLDRSPCAAPIPLLLTLRWALQILSALAFLHGKGIHYQTLSSEVLWLRGVDCSLALVGGFHYARVVLNPSWGGDRVYESSLTPWPPRRLEQRKHDIFCFGGVLFELLSGRQAMSTEEVEKGGDGVRGVIKKCWDGGFEGVEEIVGTVKVLLEGEIRRQGKEGEWTVQRDEVIGPDWGSEVPRMLGLS